jgi:hypothetical protein
MKMIRVLFLGLLLFGSLIRQAVSQSATVTVDQQLSNGVRVGTVKQWNGSFFNPLPSLPATINTSVGSTLVFQGDQALYSSQKYNNWNGINDVTNHHGFQIQNSGRLTSNFQPTYSGGVTIQSALLDTPSINAGTIGFQDPWLVDYADPNYGGTLRNQGISAPFRTLNSPFTPNTSASSNGYTYNGVFLNQGNNPLNPTPPYYSVQAPQTQSIGGYTGYFQNWTTSGAIVQGTGYTQTPVVFTAANATVTANYKGHLISSNTTPTGYNGQRRLAFDAIRNTYLQVYESAGQIWLSTAVGNGAWSNETLIGNGINPTIDSHGGRVTVAYVFQASNQVSSKIYNLDANGNISLLYTSFVPTRMTLNNVQYIVSPLPQSRPVIKNIFDYSAGFLAFDASIVPYSGGTPQSGIIVCEGETTLGGDNEFIWHIFAQVPQSFVTDPAKTVYRNPTMDLLPNSGSLGSYSKVALVWQTYTTGNDVAPINYVEVSPNFQLSSVTSLPVNAGQTVQYQKPSLVTDASGNKYIAWEAYDHNYGKNVILYKYVPSWNDPTYAMTEFVISNNSFNPSIAQKSDGTIFIFHHADGGYIRELYNTSPAYNGGSWQAGVLVSKGQYPNAAQHSTDARLAYTINSSAAPYPIAFATGYSNQNVTETLGSGHAATLLNKTRIAIGDSSGTARFALTLADVSFETGGQTKTIGVRRTPDTLHVTSANILDLLQSNSFSAATAVKVTASLSVRTKALNALRSNIAVQAELYDAATSAVLAASSPVSLTASDTAKDLTLSINTANLSFAGKSLAVRAKVSGLVPTASYHVEATNIVEASDATSSGQNTLVSLVAVPTEFSLKQNYPNPFNPATTIEYALPQAAKVSLKIYDILGREIQTLVNEPKPAGFYTATFDASRLSSGTYFYKLEARSSGSQAGSFVQTKKMVLVK